MLPLTLAAKFWKTHNSRKRQGRHREDIGKKPVGGATLASALLAVVLSAIWKEFNLQKMFAGQGPKMWLAVRNS